MRYLPDRAFPAYAHIQDQTPHPRNHPDGHSYGLAEMPSRPLLEAGWSEHEDYLFGVDLYNHGYPWEAHEAWEGPWRLAERNAPERLLLQGLIQCAACVVKALAEQPAGVASLGRSAVEILERVAHGLRPGRVYLGLEVQPFARAFHGYAARYPADRYSWPRIELALPGPDRGDASPTRP